MIHHITANDDLSMFTVGDDFGEPTHLWRTASMSRWHIARPFPDGHGITSPCGAGGVQTPSTLKWRGGMVVGLDDIGERNVVWTMLCGRCERMLSQ